MTEWRKTQGLTPNEIVVIETLLNAAKVSVSTWRGTIENFMWGHPQIVMSAIARAREQGILKEWEL